MLSATGILNNSTSLEVSWGRAANSLNYQLQQQQLFRVERGRDGAAAAVSRRGPVRLRPVVSQFRGGRTGNAGQYQTDRGPFTNENVTHDVIANITKVWGAHSVEGRLLLPAQLQAAEHLRQLQQPDRLHRQLEQPVRHRVQLRERGDRRVQQLHRRPPSTRCRNGATRTSSGTRRTTGSRTAGSRSTTACGSTT